VPLPHMTPPLLAPLLLLEAASRGPVRVEQQVGVRRREAQVHGGSAPMAGWWRGVLVSRAHSSSVSLSPESHKLSSPYLFLLFLLCGHSLLLLFLLRRQGWRYAWWWPATHDVVAGGVVRSEVVACGTALLRPMSCSTMVAPPRHHRPQRWR
jgi:hypothetical protein